MNDYIAEMWVSKDWETWKFWELVVAHESNIEIAWETFHRKAKIEAQGKNYYQFRNIQKL